MNNNYGIFEKIQFLNEGLFSFLAQKKREKNAKKITKEEYQKIKKDAAILKSKLISALKPFNIEVADNNDFEEKTNGSSIIFYGKIKDENIQKLYDKINKLEYNGSTKDYGNTQKLADNEIKKLSNKIFRVFINFAKSNNFELDNEEINPSDIPFEIEYIDAYSEKYPFFYIEMAINLEEYVIGIGMRTTKMVIVE